MATIVARPLSRPGGNASIGRQAGLRAPADGYTWVFAASALTANASLYKGLWAPLKDVTGVGVVVVAPSFIAVPATLAVVADKRLAAYPHAPTLAEAGFPEANVVPWYGYVVNSATPRPVVMRINAAIVAGNISAD